MSTEIEQYKLMFDKNIERVQSLIKIYESLKNAEAKEQRDSKFTDILRAAVVLLHSSFEEYFRNILIIIVPKTCDKDDLKKMSFHDSQGNFREKIGVSDLIEFRDKKVEELITNSIKGELRLSSFGNYNNIATWAKKAKIDLEEFKGQEQLNKLITRRHKIVHEADRANSSEGYTLAKIDKSTVEKWTEIVCDLVEIISKGIPEDM